MLTVQFGIVYFERADADIGFTHRFTPFSAELWYDQLWPLFFSVVNGAKSASQKCAFLRGLTCRQKFSIAHQFARIAVLQSGADALRRAQRNATEGDNGFILPGAVCG